MVLTPGERATVAAVAIEFRGDLAGEGDFREARRAALREAWLLPAGRVFRQAAWDEAKARLVEALTGDDYAAGELAFSEARVEADAARANLSLVVDSGPAFTLGEVQVRGFRATRSRSWSACSTSTRASPTAATGCSTCSGPCRARPGSRA